MSESIFDNDKVKMMNASEAVKYIRQFAAKTIEGPFHKPALEGQWKPMTVMELKSICNYKTGIIESFKGSEGGHDDVKVVFNPNDPRDLKDANGLYIKINLWNGYLAQIDHSLINSEINRVVKPWVDLLRRNFCSNNDVHFDWMMKHLSKIILNPIQRTKHIVVFRTQNNDLIDSLFFPFYKILGNHINKIVGKGNLTNTTKDNSAWAQTLILIIQEPIPRPDIVQEIICDKDTLELKFRKRSPFTITNLINGFVVSNEYDKSHSLKLKHSYYDVIDNDSSDEFKQQIQQIQQIPANVFLTFLSNVYSQ